VGGIALARDGRVIATAVETTRVTFHALPGDALDAYVELGEWRGRAGAYAIQERGGELLVARVDGDYLNVVGLPLERLRELLR
jgi:septum formation protein